jgi:hypothetical protein
MVHQPIVGQILINEASRSHSHIPQTIGLLWKSDQQDVENSTSQKHYIHNRETCNAPCGIRTLSPSERLQTHALDRAASGIGSRISDHELILLVTPRNYLINELILTPSHDRFLPPSVQITIHKH